MKQVTNPPLPSGEGWGEGQEPKRVHHRQSTVTARHLRKNQTEAERVFWHHVKAKRFEGYKFKRQVVIESYIADFLCQEFMLIIEIDGGQHNESERDKKRTKLLNEKSYTVVRFWNNDVLSNIEGVLSSLSLTLSHFALHAKHARERGQEKGDQ